MLETRWYTWHRWSDLALCIYCTYLALSWLDSVKRICMHFVTVYVTWTMRAYALYRI